MFKQSVFPRWRGFNLLGMFCSENSPINQGRAPGYYIEDDEVQYLLDEKALESVNEKYDGKDLLKPIGGRLHFKSEDKRYRDERCMEIYGKMI